MLRSKLVKRNTKRGKILNCSNGLAAFKKILVIEIKRLAPVKGAFK